VEFLNAFDLNICKVVLVPKQDSLDLCFLHEHVDTIKRFQHEFELIQKRKMYVSFPAYPPNLEDRLIKYLLRGFTWIKSSTDQTVIMDDFDERSVRDTVIFQKCLREHFNGDVLDYDDYVTEYRHRFICDDPCEDERCDVDKEIKIIHLPSEYEMNYNPVANVTSVKYGAGYRYPIAYHADHKEFVYKTIQGYINNYDQCPTKFLRVLEGYNMYKFIMAELDFINSDQFCDHKKLIIAFYKKAFKFQSILTPAFIAESSDNEKFIIQEFTNVLDEFIRKVSTVTLPLSELKKYLE
jgi:hypothetical protein